MKRRFEEMGNQIVEEAERELEEAVKRTENDAKLMAPVDTGRLRNSIGHRKTGFAEFEVGSNVPYARSVEYGEMRRRPQPYLRPAVEKNWERLKEGLKRAVRRGSSG